MHCETTKTSKVKNILSIEQCLYTSIKAMYPVIIHQQRR
jgi:hypothetical protein